MTSPQTPDRAAERITGSADATGRGGAPTADRGPSGRHRLLSVLPRITGDLSFGRAVDLAERIEIQMGIRALMGNGISHASLCVDIPGKIHECAYETRMRDGILVRATGEIVGAA